MTTLIAIGLIIGLIWLVIARDVNRAPDEPVYDDEDNEFENEL